MNLAIKDLIANLKTKLSKILTPLFLFTISMPSKEIFSYNIRNISLEKDMRIVFIFLLLLSFNSFAQDRSEIGETTHKDKIDLASECQNFIADFFKLTQEDQQGFAKKCLNYYNKQLADAIELTNKSEASPCDYLSLKDQVYQFNELLKNHVNADTPDQDLVENMREYFDVMYNDGSLYECSDTAYTDLLLYQYQLENSTVNSSFSS